MFQKFPEITFLTVGTETTLLTSMPGRNSARSEVSLVASARHVASDAASEISLAPKAAKVGIAEPRGERFGTIRSTIIFIFHLGGGRE